MRRFFYSLLALAGGLVATTVGQGGEFVFKLDNNPRGHKVTLDPEILTAMNIYLKQRLN
jgi:hypothetical protein